jgi:polyisoprenyl-teichoic acid--peptidoglycan teichoic acid transferase
MNYRHLAVSAIGWRPNLPIRIGIAVLTVALLIASGLSLWVRVNPTATVVAGVVPLDSPAVVVVDELPNHREPPPPPPPAKPRTGGVPRFAQPAVRGLWPPDGKAPGPAKAYLDAVDDSGGIQFVLILGSDSRGGNPLNARSDSIHILAIDPKQRRGTIVGIPRDSYINIPGHGRRKINEALHLGGPELAVRTVRELTGMPIRYYVLTAFEGMRGLVTDLGGVDGYVPYDMNEPNSGAFFQQGWHHMTGEKALAFSRNRHVPAGDFARSENQGRLMLDVLKKLRAETSRQREVESWINIALGRVRLDMSFPEAVRLGVLTRVTAASSVRNFTAAGSTGSAGGASVVFLNDQAFALFKDVAQDAIADGSYPTFGPPPQPDQEAAPEQPAAGPAPAAPTVPLP